MRFNTLIILSILLSILACDGLNQMKNVEDNSPGKILRKEFQTSTGKSIFISEKHPIGQSLSNIIIESKGFEHEMIDSIVDSDPIEEIFMADLDSNGFDELYIVIRSAGTGSYGNILAYASNKDLSLSRIYLENQDTSPSAEYSGHDRFSIEKGKLKRSFNLYDSDSIYSVSYELMAGEASWLLKLTTN